MNLKTLNKLDYKPIVTVAAFLFYPFIVLTIIGWFFIPFLRAYFKEIIGFGLFSFVFVVLFFLVNYKTFRKFIFLTSYLLLAFLAFFKLSFYYHYGVKLSASALFVIFETNTSEASDFLSNYFDGTILLLSIVFIIPLLFIGSKQFFLAKTVLKFNEAFYLKVKPKVLKIPLFLFGILALYGVQWKFKAENILFTGYSSYQEYIVTKKNLRSNLAQETSTVFNVLSTNKDPQTYVVIIGESTSRWHMQLYGYKRETNPLLSEIKGELAVFDSVITPDVHTILALEKALTLSNTKKPNIQPNGSVVQLANQAGFITYWLSNQKPVGLHESISTIIANAAHHKYFIATDNYNYNIYDEALLPVLDKVLNEKVEKKIIFIHLIGTHSDYKKRYSESFEHFKDTFPNLTYKHKKAIKVTNEYDNATLYNDFIVRTIIDKVKAKNTLSYVAYFSDHGDEVYDTMDLMGHNSYHATRPMHEIPFIVWFSEKYKTDVPFSGNFENITKNRYSLEDFIYTFSDLSQIDFENFDASRSIFNSAYKKRTRYIKNNIDYDAR